MIVPKRHQDAVEWSTKLEIQSVQQDEDHDYNSNVKYVLMYGSECWRVVETNIIKLDAFHNIVSEKSATSNGLARSPTRTCMRKQDAATYPWLSKCTEHDG